MEKVFQLSELNERFEEGRNKELSRETFSFQKLIGSGGFGKVYKVRSNSTRRIYAMKVLSKNQIKHYSMRTQLKREIQILDTHRHHRIVRLYACFEDKK